MPHADESFGLGIGKGLQQHRVDDAENGRIRADADGEREQGDRRESGRAPEAPRRQPQLGSEVEHRDPSWPIGDSNLKRRYDPMTAGVPDSIGRRKSDPVGAPRPGS